MAKTSVDFFTDALYDQLSEEHKSILAAVDMKDGLKSEGIRETRRIVPGSPDYRRERDKFYHSKIKLLGALVGPPTGPIMPKYFSGPKPWLISKK